MRYSTKAFTCALCLDFATRCIALADDTRLWFCWQHLADGHELERILRVAIQETGSFAEASGLVKIILDQRAQPIIDDIPF